MQLSEIKNDLAIINYSPEINRLMLSDVILIEDNNQSILAQIISIEATMEEDVNSAMLKFLLSIDKDANLTQYSGYVPAKNATLILINPDEVVQLIKGNEKNIHIGNLASYKDVPVELSLDFFRKKTYIQVDFIENKLQIVETIIKGLEKHNRKTLLFDFQGFYESISLPTVTLGYNFKLPLNYEALCYIAEEELKEFNNDNKAVIQGILIEVQNYVKNLEDEFIPFDTLISVLDAQYEESPMPELLLLKNKLLKYQQQGIFAQEKSEFDFLDTFLKDAKNFKFDLSEIPSQWHKIAFVSILNIIKAKCYLIADFTEDNSNKTIIKKLYEKTEIKPIVISSYEYIYQLQLKAMSKNMILFKPIQKVNDFEGYTSFLNILSQDTFIVWGEQTLFIPLILKMPSSYKTDTKIDKNIIQRPETSENSLEEITSNEEIDNSSENIVQPEITTVEEIQEYEDGQEENSVEIISGLDEVANEFSDDEEAISDDEIITPEEISDYVETLKENLNNDSDIESIDELITEPIEEISESNIADIIESEMDAEIAVAEESAPSEDTVLPEENSIIPEDIEIIENPIEEEITEPVQIETQIEEEITEPVRDENTEFKESVQEESSVGEVNDTEIESVAEVDTNTEISGDTQFEDIQSEEDLPNADDLDFFFEEQTQEDEILTESPDKISNNNEQTDNITADRNFISENTKDTEENTANEITENVSENDIVEDLESVEIDENLNQNDEILIEEESEPQPKENNVINESLDSFKEPEEKEEESEKEDNYQIPVKPTVEIKKAIQTPADNSDIAPQFNTKFAQGTYVYHPKYGMGIVEKVTTFGEKELCMVIFDSVGRRTMDPNIADLKQV